MYRSRKFQYPSCPFCEAKVKRPRLPAGEAGAEFAAGACGCGALYASDPTGKKLGAALMELLFRLAGGGVEQALSLQRGRDYEERMLSDYHERIHQVRVGAPQPGRRMVGGGGSGVLIFLKRK